MEDPLLHRAIENAKLGFYDDARRLLLQFIRQDPNNVQAWLWLAQVLDDPHRQLDCLRQVLRLDPHNPDALAGMEALRVGRPMPEPGGGVVIAPEKEPEPELYTPEQALEWGVLFTPEPAAPPPPSPAPDVPPAAVYEETPPFFEEMTPSTAGEAEEESFLRRARRLRAARPSVPAAPEAAPVSVAQPPTALPSVEPLAEVVGKVPAPTPERKFRLFDRRVFFSLLGLIELPLLVVVWLLLMRSGAAPWPIVAPAARPVRPASKVCRDLNLADFTRFETLGGSLTTDTFFTGTVMITETLVVPEEYRLLLYPGATLVFSPGTTIEVYGILYACGHETAPVTFTTADKTPGGWEGIRLYNPAQPTVLSQVRIEYAGERALYLLGSVPLLSDLTIAYSALFPISTDGNALPDISQRVNLFDNPIKGIEIRAGTLKNPNIVWSITNVAYVVSGAVQVDEQATLDIRPGVVVKFWLMPHGSLPGLWVRGLLKAEGAQFTSLYDSHAEVGGASYLEAIDPRPGDWGSITFYQSSEKSYLRKVTIRYGGRVTAAVLLRNSSPELTEVTIADSAGYPLNVDINSFPRCTMITLTDNRAGNALEIEGGTPIGGEEERTWSKLGGETPLARVIRDTITVGPQAKLTIEPGVVVKFAPTGKLVVQGVLSAVGNNTPAEKIIFTSLHDDEYGGDSDGLTTPRDNRAWGGISLEGVDATTVMQHVIVRYAPVTLMDAAPKLSNVQFYSPAGSALQMTPQSSPTFQSLQFEGGGMAGVAVLTGTLETDHTWTRLGTATDQVVRVLAGEVTVGPNAVLVIDAGTVIKAAPAGKLKVSGHLRAVGRSDQMIIFTSLNDDRAGDTNGRKFNAGAGDWPGIELEPEANVRLEYVGIYYARVGLLITGKVMPTIEGRVHIAYGKQPLSCKAKMQLPPAFLFEDNEVAVTRCPSP